MRLAAISLALALATVLGGCASSGDKAVSTTSRAPVTVASTFECPEVPVALGRPLAWFPEDLPLPPGTYAVGDETQPGAQFQYGVFVAPTDLKGLATTLLQEWPKHGWVLGRGESEPGEIETSFVRGNGFGAVRARSSYCDPNLTALLIAFGRREFSPSSSPSSVPPTTPLTLLPPIHAQ